jgi:hypothetical protein
MKPLLPMKKQQAKRAVASKADQLLIEANDGIYFYEKTLNPIAYFICSVSDFERSKGALVREGWQLLT